MQLPLRVKDERAIQCLRVLKAAGVVDAVFTEDSAGKDCLAEVIAITEKGRVALAQYAQGKPFP